MFPLEFRAEVNHKETRVIGLSSSEDPTIVAWVIHSASVWRTDGRTDLLQSAASTALWIASYADAVWRAVKMLDVD